MNKKIIGKILSILWKPFKWVFTAVFVIIGIVVVILYVLILMIFAGLGYVFSQLRDFMTAFLVGLLQGIEEKSKKKKEKTTPVTITGKSKTVH